jgi:chromosome segregation ATPase
MLSLFRVLVVATSVAAALSLFTPVGKYARAFWKNATDMIEVPDVIELRVIEEDIASLAGDEQAAKREVAAARVAARNAKIDLDRHTADLADARALLRDLADRLEAGGSRSGDEASKLRVRFGIEWAKFKDCERAIGVSEQAVKRANEWLRLVTDELDQIIKDKEQLRCDFEVLKSDARQLRNEQRRVDGCDPSRLGAVKERIAQFKQKLATDREYLAVERDYRPTGQSGPTANPAALQEFRDRFGR